MLDATPAKSEAEFLYYGLSRAPGQTIEKVRRDIELSVKDEEIIRAKFGEIAASQSRLYRDKILARFDEIAANPLPEMIRKFDRRRAAVIKAWQTEKLGMRANRNRGQRRWDDKARRQTRASDWE